MNRFSYRVYSFEQKRMIYSWDYTNKRDFLYGALIDHRYFGKGLYVTMQSTGLKDKNGKLIYEGDIVRFYSLYGYATFEIKWSKEFATFGYEDKETDFSEFGRLYEQASFVEVIGNIYENPELLEDNK